MENEKNDRAMHRKARKKVCHFCVDRVEAIDYKDVARLRKFISERATIKVKSKIPLERGGFFVYLTSKI